MYWPNKIITTISLIGAFAFVTLSPPARAVIPAPDGGYPNQNTAEGEDAVLSRNTPASGTWTATGSMGTARYEHTATLLPNGKVLVAGGLNGLSSAELYDPASGTWTATGSMGTARYEHTATLLPNGKVLVAGGYNGPALSSAELYDPASGTWTATGSMGTARGEHTATLLPSGKVLVAGGFDLSNALSSAELYDPVTGTWTATGSMSTARYDHTATLLPNGQALVAAGTDSDFRPLRSAELYDPASGTWTATGSMVAARGRHTATLLPSGKVLVAGGFNGLSSAELYDPASGTWSATGSMGTARFDHTATLLPSGEVLVAGGYNFNDGYLSSAELYDPASGTWSATGGMGTARAQHTATLLPNGKVLVAGGSNGVALSSAELYVSDGGGELTLVSAASRKTHGSKGAFDISLPLTGDLGIECRTGLTRNVVVMTFNNNVTGADSASSSCGTIGSVSVDPADAHNLLVTFNGAGCNASTVTVTATNVHDDQGNTLSSASASMGILVGDVTGDGRVTNGDTAVVQAVQGQQTNASNFRDDVTLDGKVNTQDVQTVRSHRGEVLP
jgi:hypothetical protein